MGCIYLVTNDLNGKRYVGKTMHTAEARWRSHCYEAELNRSKSALHDAIRKYGKDVFLVAVLDKSTDEAYLFEREAYWINRLGTFQEYNLTTGGEGPSGRCVSDMTKRKMSEALHGRVFSEEHRQNLSEAKRGNTARLGQPHTEETKQKIAARLNGNANRKGQRGYHHTDEARAKMSERSGHPQSEETRQKIGEASRNRPRKPCSEETKEKIRQSLLKRNAAR